jgi:hypothetical protein
LIANVRRCHRRAGDLSRYTNRPPGRAVGAVTLEEIFVERFYNDTEGGLLGGLGQLFKNPARLYVYPNLDLETGRVTTVENFPIAPHLEHLYAHLRDNRFIVGIEPTDREFLPIRRKDILAKIQAGDPSWEGLVPPPIVALIKRDGLFGFPAGHP